MSTCGDSICESKRLLVLKAAGLSSVLVLIIHRSIFFYHRVDQIGKEAITGPIRSLSVVN